VFEIWSDNLLEGDWFSSLDKRMANAPIRTIGKRGTNPKIIDDLVFYDRPDIILLNGGKPVLVLEKTAEVPTGHNVGQRFARLVRSAEFGLPTFFFVPFDKRKQGVHSSMCNVNARLLRAMLRVGQIHDCPVLPVNWPCDDNGELLTDGTENEEISRLVSAVLNEMQGLATREILDYEIWVASELSRREAVYPSYKVPPKSVKFIETETFIAAQPFHRESFAPLLSRSRSLVYVMDMSPDKCKRQDPYTGMQFIYDYIWLRTGSRPQDRDTNLILHVPNVTKETWLDNNPDDYQTKSCNWYLTADAICLSDGVIAITNWPKHHDN
jgi:hypothetical protein